MIRTELSAAGIDDPELREAYQRCRTLNAAHGRTFFLATRLLARISGRRSTRSTASRVTPTTFSTTSTRPWTPRPGRPACSNLSDEFFSADEHPGNPVLAAVRHTARRYAIGDELFDDFLTSMRMDLTVTDYPDRDALNLYMKGSAEAIGLQVLPILGTIGPGRRGRTARRGAGQGVPADELPAGHRRRPGAWQRVYLPADELASYDVDRDLLMWCHTNRTTDHRVRNALADQHDIARQRLPLRRRRCRRAGAAVAAVRRDRADAVLRDPRPHRRQRLRGVQPARHRGQRTTAARRRRRPDPVVAGPADAPAASAASQIWCGVMDRWQYLIVLGACLAITLPLEIFRPGVYRQAWRAARAVLPVAAVSCCGTKSRSAPTSGLQPRLRHRREHPVPHADRRGLVLSGDSVVRLADLQRGQRHPATVNRR